VIESPEEVCSTAEARDRLVEGVEQLSPSRRCEPWSYPEGPVFGRRMNNLKRDHITLSKEKRMKWNCCMLFVAVSPRTCMRWEFLQKLYREDAVTPTKQPRRSAYIHATEPGVRSGMRKLEA